MLDFHNYEFASGKERGNSSLTFVPVRMVTKTRRLPWSRKNKDKKTVHDIDNALRTKILVTNDGLQTRRKTHIKKKKKGFRNFSSLSGQQTANNLQNLLKKKNSAHNLSDTKGSILSGNLGSLGKNQLFRQILQSY